MTAEKQIKSVENKETDNNFDDFPDFVKNTLIYDTKFVSDSVTNWEKVIISETQQTPLLPLNLSTTLKPSTKF